MTIGHQIGAARGLLRWSGAYLAEEAGLTRDTIVKIESDVVQPREGTLADIMRVFDENGVEFIGNSGVRLKPQGVEILVGQGGLQQFFDGVYEHARKHGGSIVQFGIDENLFWAVGAEFSEMHRRRMAELVRVRHDVRVQAILCEGDTNFIASEYNKYRWIGKEIFSPVPFYIYGERLAIMTFQTVPSPTIVQCEFPAITAAYRKQFETFWKLSREPEADGRERARRGKTAARRRRK
jgi:transcriptional regulator with XRE-family HTH domain